VDIKPNPLIPKWKNGRQWDAIVAKRLDKFLLAKDLVETFFTPKSWIATSNLSNYLPIVL